MPYLNRQILQGKEGSVVWG